MRGDISLFYRNNPIASLILGKSRYKGRRIGGLFLAWWTILWAVCAVDGISRSSQLPDGTTAIGFVDDLIMPVSICCQWLLLMALLRAMKTIQQLMISLPDALCVESSNNSGLRRKRLQDLVYRTLAYMSLASEPTAHRLGGCSRKRWHQWPLFLALNAVLLLIVAICQGAPFLQRITAPAWVTMPREHTLAFVFATAWNIWSIVFVGGTALWYSLCTVFCLFPVIDLFMNRNAFRVVSLCEQDHQAIRLIGDVAISLVCVVGCGIPFVIAWLILAPISGDFRFAFGLACYMVILSVTFLIPVLATHRAMRRGKEAQQRRLERTIAEQYTQVIFSTGKSDQSDDMRVKSIEGYDRLSTIINRLPVWPYSWRAKAAFVVTIVVTAITFIGKDEIRRSAAKLWSMLFN